jgi:Regulator of G protein signaling domain
MVVSRFLTPGASCELNVSPAVRNRTLEMAGTSTHPDVFKEVAEAAYRLVESSSLPNFVKYATSNINKPKMNFCLYVGTTDFLIGLLIYFLCIFLRVSIILESC